MEGSVLASSDGQGSLERIPVDPRIPVTQLLWRFSASDGVGPVGGESHYPLTPFRLPLFF